VLSTHAARFAPATFKGDFAANAAAIATMGYDGVELTIRDPRLVDAGELLGVLRSTGLVVPAIGTGLAWGEEGLSLTDPDPAVRSAALARLWSHFELAGRVGAAGDGSGGTVVIWACCAGPQARSSPGAGHGVADRGVAEKLRRGREFGVRIALEPINRYETT